LNLQQAELVSTGFKYDRHWMVVDKQGQFLTQRQLPGMARISTELQADSLLLNHENATQLEIPLHSHNNRRIPVTIWNDQNNAILVSAHASIWFSEILNVDCDLVYLPESEQRWVDKYFARNDEKVGFADGFPLLVLSRASIDELNQQLDEEVNINRFRANIVLDDCPAHAEDDWATITVNNISIRLAKPCSRCIIPSIHQQTAEKHPTLLRTLASYRRREGKVFVGQNGIHSSTGFIHVGDPVDYTLK